MQLSVGGLIIQNFAKTVHNTTKILIFDKH